MTVQRVSASRRIKASARALFEIVTSPEGHVRFDGSGMLTATPDARPLTAVGDVFDMEMDRTPLSDIPGLVEYKVRNTVTQIGPDPRGVDDRRRRSTAARARRRLAARCGERRRDRVTNYCDWTDITPELRARRPDWPIVPVSMLEQSVAKLDEIATGG